MRTILAFVIGLLFAGSASAQGFLDIRPSTTWTKVQDGETTQWSIVSLSRPDTRIDLVSYEENGARTTYYLVRSACATSEVAKIVLKPGNRVGIGTDCNGNNVTATTILGSLPPLPPEASNLLSR